MAADLTKTTDAAQEALSAQVSELRNELAKITKGLSKQGVNLAESAQDTASEFYDIVRERGKNAADEVGKQAKRVGETARENPLATAAILAGIGLLIGLIVRR